MPGPESAPRPRVPGRCLRPSRRARGHGGRPTWLTRAAGLGSTGCPGSGLSWRAWAEARGGGGGGAGRAPGPAIGWRLLAAGQGEERRAAGRWAEPPGRAGAGSEVGCRAARGWAREGRDRGPEPSRTAWRRGCAGGRGGRDPLPWRVVKCPRLELKAAAG